MEHRSRFVAILPAVLICGCVLRLGSAGCSGGQGARADASGTFGGGDGALQEGSRPDLCGSFSGAGTRCPLAGPFLCFPECDAGGCTCDETAEGPRWSCVTDLSCIPDCAPIDENCGVSGND